MTRGAPLLCLAATAQDVLDATLMQQVARHVGWLKEKHPEQRPENLNETLAHGDPFWLRLVSDPRLLDIAERFVGPDIAQVHEQSSGCL